MNPRRVQLLLRALSVLLVLAGGVVVALTWMELPDRESMGDQRAPATRPATHAVASLPSLPDFETIWARRLRPSFGPAVADGMTPGIATVPGAATPQTVAGVTLVGTIGSSVALVRDGAGNVEAHQVGETVAGGGEVVAVRPSEMDLRVNGQVVTLRRIADAPATPLAPPEDDPQIGPVAEGQQ